MKYNLFKIGILIVLLLAFSVCGWAGTTDDETVSVKIGETYVLYYGTIDMSDDTTGTFKTQAMHFQELSEGTAYAYVVCSEAGTEDVNVTAEYSMDGTNFVAASAIDGLDACGTTAKQDTVDIITGVEQVKHRVGKWIRLSFVGQTGNGDTTISWWILFRKGEPFRGSGGDKSWYGTKDVT